MFSFNYRQLFRGLGIVQGLNLLGFFSKYLSRKPSIMTVNSPEFKNLFTDEMNTLLDLFEKHNYEIRIAGGAVRDILSGKNPKDVDFATTATPGEMKKMFEAEEVRMINEKGEKHGTITARINNENFEVTTLRIDVTCDGRHSEVEFTKNWELDANRRDLTINSMFLDRNGSVYDYFHGLDDLKNKRVAFVGNPHKRIQEDYLRILRYFRFYGRISEKPDCHEEETITAIRDNISGLGKISGERIWQELSKILAGNYATSLIQKMIAVGAGAYIGFPEKPNIGELISVWEKGKNLNLHPMTLLSAIMNNEEDIMLFHRRCKLSLFDKNLGLFIVQSRNNESNDLKPYQTLMLKTDGNLKDKRRFITELFKYKADLNLLHEFQSWEPPKFPINGVILKEHGVPGGRKLGHVLKNLKDYWVDQDFKPGEKELIDRIPEILKHDKSV